MAVPKRLSDMEAIRIVQWLISNYFFEISECIAIIDPVVRQQLLDQLLDKLNEDTMS